MQPVRRHRSSEAGDEGRHVGDMLDHFEAGDKIILSAESLDAADAIVDLGRPCPAALFRARLDIFRVPRREFKATCAPSRASGSRAGRRCNRRRRRAGPQRPEIVLVEPPMLIIRSRI